MTAARLVACPQCDILLKKIDIDHGVKAHCPRCGYLLYQPRRFSVEKTFALSITGLILFIPANLLPLIGIKILGNIKDGTLWSGVATLYNEGMWGLAILVFLASMLFPFLKIFLSFLVSGCLYLNMNHPRLIRCMCYLKHMDEWAMLEVYTLGIIVACVKLESMAELRFGFGLYAFAGLLLIIGLLSSNLDEDFFWLKIANLSKSAQDKQAD